MENRNGFGKSVCNAQLIRKFNMKVAIATPSIRRNLFSCFLWQSWISSYRVLACSMARSFVRCVACPHWCATKRACVQNTLHISFCAPWVNTALSLFPFVHTYTHLFLQKRFTYAQRLTSSTTLQIFSLIWDENHNQIKKTEGKRKNWLIKYEMSWKRDGERKRKRKRNML